MSDLQHRYADAVMNTFGPPKLVLTRGEGAYVWDDDGNRYLDLLGGIAVNALGHGHPALVDAVTTQLRTLGHVSNFFATEPQVELAERLLQLLGQPGHVFFTSSGHRGQRGGLQALPSHRADAPGRRRGRLPRPHAWARSRSPPRPPTASRSSRCPATSPSSRTATWRPSRRAVTDRTAAVVLEPVQGEAGVVVPPDGYLAAARRITSDQRRPALARRGADRDRPHRSLVRAHGVGRRSRRGHGGQGARRRHPRRGLHRRRAVQASCCSRATTAPRSAATRWPPPRRSPCCARSRTDGLLDHVTALGKKLADGVGHEHVTEVRGRGLLIGLDLDAPKASAVARAALRRGFIVNDCTPERIRLAPPLVLTEAQVADFLAAWPMILADAYATEETPQ